MTRVIAISFPIGCERPYARAIPIKGSAMQINRRNALRLAAGSALVTSLVGQAFAKARPLKVLILGGTGFIGPHFVRVLAAGGHTVTLFNRGKRDPEARPGV